MIISLVFLATVTFFGVFTFYYKTEVKMPRHDKKNSLISLIIIGLLVRIIAAFFYQGHETDMICFDSWSEMLKNNGFLAFYTSETFTDYPPGYMYILYFLGFIKDIFGKGTIFTYIILKLPAIISDILCGICIYKLCEKHGQKKFKSLLAGFFIFNPAVIFNSAVWGQVDSVFTLFILLMLFALTEGKMIHSYFLFAIAIFIKPQALFYTPVVLFGVIENVFLNEYTPRKLVKNLLGGLCAIFSVFVLALPFGINNVISQYINTLGSYSYASVNAYNLWSALGFNWSPLSTGTSLVGYFFILVTVLISAMIFFSGKDKNRYFLSSAFICFSVFILSVKMHERYAFPVMALLICAYALSSKKEEMYLYFGISAIQFLNMYQVLFYYNVENVFEPQYEKTMIVMGIISVAIFAVFCIYVFRKCSKTLLMYNRINDKSPLCEAGFTKKDLIAMGVITLIYSAIALFNLGSFKAPQTFETINANSSIMLDLGEEKEVSKINIYLGAQDINESTRMNISAYNQDGDLTYDEEITDGNVFYWETYDNISSPVRYIEIYGSDKFYIGEIGVFSNTGEKIKIVNAPTYVIDEQDIVPDAANHFNSTYFDEIYHARTAYEFIHKLSVYEWTHPPLGKIFISLGVSIFGMTPFGWRIIGTLFGILMIPIFYFFTKKMFKSTWISLLSSIVFTFDFMHFTQTRIATIDVYVTFFIMLMYLFMYKYVNSDLSRKPIFKTFIPLGISGLFMGLGIACKWTGVYAGAGLAVILFSALYIKYKNKEIDSKYIAKNICFCLGAFVLVPVLIYILSYIPFIRANGTGFYSIIQNQIDMLSYHGKTVVLSEHSYSSPWYQWLVNYRPIWYYTRTIGDFSENISAFGNPLVWSAGLIAFFYCLYDAIRHRNKNAVFLVVAYLAQLLPWTLVTRTTFIYHYFTCVPFLVLMIAHFVDRMYQHYRIIKPFYVAFTVFAVLLFILFYPVISGFPVNGDFVRNFLRWLPSWQLIG